MDFKTDMPYSSHVRLTLEIKSLCTISSPETAGFNKLPQELQSISRISSNKEFLSIMGFILPMLSVLKMESS